MVSLKLEKVVKERRRSLRRRLGQTNYLWFTRGNVFTVSYRLKGYGYVFTGLCVRVKKRSMLHPSTTFMLRNIFSKISVELHIALYGLGRLTFKFLDYARKKFTYRGAKLYYLRAKSNIESWVVS